jgi:hypothetical protein
MLWRRVNFAPARKETKFLGYSAHGLLTIMTEPSLGFYT